MVRSMGSLSHRSAPGENLHADGLSRCRSPGTAVGVSGTGHAGDGWRRRTLPIALWNQCGKNRPATATKAKSFDATLNAIVDGVDGYAKPSSAQPANTPSIIRA